MRKVIAIRKMDQADRQEQEALLDVYLHAIEGGAQIRATADVLADPEEETGEE